MAVPVIFPTISVLCFKQGQEFYFQPAASNAPTSWEAVGLPVGVEIDADTGLISGMTLGIGVYDVTLRAINGDGPSADFVFPLIFLEAVGTLDEAIELDVDLASGQVTSQATQGAVINVKQGDKLLLSIGFKKGNSYQFMPGLTDISFGLKEFEPEKLLILSDAGFARSLDGWRVLMVVDFDARKLRASLSGYESDKGTSYSGLGEIQWSWERAGFSEDDALELKRSTLIFPVLVERALRA